MKFLFKCDESAKVCDKCQYEEADFWDSLRMKVHLMICKYCRDYSTNNSKLTKSLKSADIKSFPKNKKAILKKQINQEINTHPKP